ncbi:glutamyl-tRNA amidotransferase [Thermotoga sp. Ku-13t]|uniref:Asp-tRNA(Asn)/Glu-tRNA(Gln) amidotransferase subunit GatA n=1 Tax=Thermotoga sp. Ku-13t TaxID=1755813 RepID=UPI0013ECDAA7|nr:Asp-tRNA(Asn)/Glu-tRNA(Gln) amidotransferase subunit GatA [Thermotoga sp. Ku-13t]KAF2958167.1 glutamyl-tRNA amidotransferase [Thermotoga sp. Ku-13t]
MFQKMTIEDCLEAERDNLVKESLQRIEEIDHVLRSFITVLKAEQIEVKDGPFRGIPVAVKDNIVTKGVRTTCASRILENYVPPYDATVVRKLREVGFAIVGKTNLDEFAMGSSTERSAFFVTRNPWDLSCVPGGSSGGSAAAVASGEVVAALGSDTGGSVRQPAAFCGIVGFKPTYGLVSRYGLVAFASSLDQIGPMTKSVRDAAILMQIIHGRDPMDSTTVDVKMDFLSHIEEGIENFRFAVPEEVYEYEGLDGEVAERFEECVRLIEKLGGRVRKVRISTLKYAVATYYVIAPAEASSNLARYDGVKYGLRAEKTGLKETYSTTRTEGFGEEVRRRIVLGTFTLSATYYEAYFNRAQKVRRLIANDLNTTFDEFDAILTPTSPIPAFKIGSITDPLAYYLMDVFTTFANLAGVPALSVPFGFARGLPVGIQIVGKRFDDPKVLRIGRAIEKSSPYNENGRFPTPVVRV